MQIRFTPCRLGKVSVIVGAGFLAACDPVPADNCAAANRDITFGNLISNEVSGSYEGCLTDLRATLQRLRLESRALQFRANELHTQAAALDGQRAANTRRLANLNAEQARLMQNIGDAESARNVNEAELRNILQQERALRSEVEGATPDDAVEAARLAAEQRQIEARLQAVLR